MGSRGISLSNLTKSVYNLSHTFFFTPEYDDVYRQVQQYVYRNSKTPSSLIERMETRGRYRINKASKEAEQLFLTFQSDINSESLD